MISSLKLLTYSCVTGCVLCRWYSIIIGAEICKIDLLNMLMFNEEDNKEPAPHVWRN